MKIEIKQDPGKLVFFMYDNHVKEGIIEKIYTETTCNYDPHGTKPTITNVWYEVVEQILNKKPILHRVKKVYSTKQDLLDNL